jgi:hypothetical protein
MPLVCPGHSRGIVQLEYSPVTVDGYFLISACLGMFMFVVLVAQQTCHRWLSNVARRCNGQLVGNFSWSQGSSVVCFIKQYCDISSYWRSRLYL